MQLRSRSTSARANEVKRILIQKTQQKLTDPKYQVKHTNRRISGQNAPCANKTLFKGEVVRWWSKGRSRKWITKELQWRRKLLYSVKRAKWEWNETQMQMNFRLGQRPIWNTVVSCENGVVTGRLSKSKYICN